MLSNYKHTFRLSGISGGSNSSSSTYVSFILDYDPGYTFIVQNRSNPGLPVFAQLRDRGHISSKKLSKVSTIEFPVNSYHFYSDMEIDAFSLLAKCAVAITENLTVRQNWPRSYRRIKTP